MITNSPSSGQKPAFREDRKDRNFTYFSVLNRTINKNKILALITAQKFVGQANKTYIISLFKLHQRLPNLAPGVLI